ncbi:MAG TPA: hypothetical protein VFH47_00600 [Candidatus Thermoplasmatota archaeon]|nr:hypothetical protein [Candidatus Thermoplasmatota archaeon]
MKPWLRVVRYCAAALVGLAAAVATLLGVHAPGSGTGKPAELYLAQTEALQTLTFVVLGAGAMAWGWRKRFAGWHDELAVAGAAMWTLAGFVMPDPGAAAVLPGFLLPWLLLVVGLPARHRVVLLGTQWLSSIMLLETLGQSAASTVGVATLGALHLALVWTTLRDTPLRWVPLAFGAVLAATAFAVAAAFLVAEPTLRRGAAILVPLAAIGALTLMARGRILAHARVPLLLRPA